MDAHGGAAFTHNDISLIVAKNNWALGYGYRYDYQIDVSDDFARVYANTKQNKPLAPKTYELRAAVQHFSADFLRINYQLQPSSHLSITPQINLLHLRELASGDMNFMVTTTGESSVRPVIEQGQGYVDYVYDHPLLKEQKVFAWDPNQPTGYGVTTDIQIVWQVQQNMRGQLSVLDALNYLHWDDVPRTQYNAHYIEKPLDYDLDGQLSVLSGYRQSLKPWFIAEGQYQLPYLALFLKNTHYASQDLLQVGVSCASIGQEVCFGVSYWVTPKAWDLSFRYKNNVDIQIGMDDYNYQKAKFLNLKIGFNYVF